MGETCERGKSWKSMDGIHNSDKENDARVWEEKMNSETFQRVMSYLSYFTIISQTV